MYVKRINLLALAIILFIGFSCTQNTNKTDGGDNTGSDNNSAEAPAENNPAKFNDARVESLEVRSEKNSDSVFVLVHGKVSKPCEHLADIKQERNGNNIKIMLTTVIPPGISCPDVEVPMHHSIPINTKGLAPGTYNVDINGQKTSFVKK